MKTEISEYDLQAIDFLKSTNTDFKAEFLRFGIYFDGDKDERDIYKITLTRKGRFYSFEFGQSVANSGAYIVKDFNPKFTRVFNTKADGYFYASKYGCRNGVQTNPARKEPTAYDVLACITKYDPGTFENFCSEFGYDTDSRKAKKTYKAVKKEFAGMQSLFTDSELEQMQEIN